MSKKRRALVCVLLPSIFIFASPASGQTRPPAPPASGQTRPPAPAAAQIDLNSASRDDLMSLDGIGEVRADAIIRARPFKAKTELVERHIIPEELYNKLADKVMARPVPAAPPAKK